MERKKKNSFEGAFHPFVKWFCVIICVVLLLDFVLTFTGFHNLALFVIVTVLISGLVLIILAGVVLAVVKVSISIVGGTVIFSRDLNDKQVETLRRFVHEAAE